MMNSRLIQLYLCLAVVVGIASALPHSHWTSYKRQFGKTYHGDEDAVRKTILAETARKVSEHNANPERSFTMGLNHLSDWTQEELAKLNGVRVPEHQLMNSPEAQRFLDEILNSDAPVPDSLDWRTVPGRVTPVKDQGQCGSCWAFVTTGMLEGQEIVRSNFSRSKTLVGLSEQELMDCSTSDSGCDGGFMLYALSDIKSMGGIDGEKEFPYTAKQGKCRFDKKGIVMTENGGVLLPQGNPAALKKAVATFGPVAVAMDAEEDFMTYKSGVYNSLLCGPGAQNHGALVVGYGTDPKEGDYWIAKNSWGDKWGEGGYFKISQENDCGFTQFATIAAF